MIEPCVANRRFRSAWPVHAAVLLAAAALAACATTSDPDPGTMPPGVMRTSLPPVPPVSGPISLYVEYPDSLQIITRISCSGESARVMRR